MQRLFVREDGSENESWPSHLLAASKEEAHKDGSSLQLIFRQVIGSRTKETFSYRMTEEESPSPKRRLLKGHGYHMLESLTPDLKGFAEVVGLNEGTLYRLGTAA